MLPADVQAVIRKPEKERTAAEQKIADDYFPVLRIDSGQDPGDHARGRSEDNTRSCSGSSTRRAAAGAVGAAGLLDRGSRSEEGAARRATS